MGKRFELDNTDTALKVDAAFSTVEDLHGLTWYKTRAGTHGRVADARIQVTQLLDAAATFEAAAKDLRQTARDLVTLVAEEPYPSADRKEIAALAQLVR